MIRILIIGAILLTLIGCSTSPLKVGVTKEKALLQLEREPDVYKISDYELWCCFAVKHELLDIHHTDFYILKNDKIVYLHCCRFYRPKFDIDKVKYLMTDWINNNTSQTDLHEEIDDILNKKVRIGMRQMQVILSWGYPDNINETVGSWGKNEQWVYGDIIYSARLLYFENGVLTSWQNSGK